MKDFSKSLLVACAAVVFTASMALADSNINKSRSVPDGGSTTVPQFAKVIDDLPIMPGLVPQEDKDVLFIAGPRRIGMVGAVLDGLAGPPRRRDGDPAAGEHGTGDPGALRAPRTS